MNRKDIRILKVMLLALFAIFSFLVFGIGISVIKWLENVGSLFEYLAVLILGFTQSFLYWRLGRQFSRIDREAKNW